MTEPEQIRWQVIKSLLDEFPELAERAAKYLQAREKEGKGCSERSKGSKKAIITISLIEGNSEIANEAIEREIFEELSKGLPRIPWLQKVEKVTVMKS